MVKTLIFTMGFVVILPNGFGEVMGNAGGWESLCIASLLLFFALWISLLHFASSGIPAGLSLRVPALGCVPPRSEFKVRLKR